MGLAYPRRALALALLIVAACSDTAPTAPDDTAPPRRPEAVVTPDNIIDLFNTNPDPNVTLEVNRYIWTATLEVLSFMPVETADPFSGILVFGYGTPPGGSTPYRATVQIKDPALEARSLNLALATRSGPVAPDTVREVENAILTRARQLRIADNDL